MILSKCPEENREKNRAESRVERREKDKRGERKRHQLHWRSHYEHHLERKWNRLSITVTSHTCIKCFSCLLVTQKYYMALKTDICWPDLRPLCPCITCWGQEQLVLDPFQSCCAAPCGLWSYACISQTSECGSWPKPTVDKHFAKVLCLLYVP